jgi:hypothetical protein
MAILFRGSVLKISEDDEFSLMEELIKGAKERVVFPFAVTKFFSESVSEKKTEGC